MNSSLFQHGSIWELLESRLHGTLTMQEALKYGDTGLGTGDKLDGELVILEGVPYLVRQDGSVTSPEETFTLPYVNCHFADFQYFHTFTAQTMSECYAYLEHMLPEHHFCAIRISGLFEYMQTRTVCKQDEPFQGLHYAESVQKVFSRKFVRGSAIGYFSPHQYKMIASAGIHLHFLDDERSFGGHILDFKVEKAVCDIQVFSEFLHHFAVTK